jgi:hypothetical protein
MQVPLQFLQLLAHTQDPELQLLPVGVVQSLSWQHCPWGMHTPLHSLKGPEQEHFMLPPQVPPSPQSLELQQPDVEAHAPLQMPGIAAGQTHVPFVHTCPITAVQSMAALQQLPDGMHAPLQDFCPNRHMHVPF